MSVFSFKHPPPERDDDKRELHLRWLVEIQSNGVNLSVWEEEFVESIDTALSLGHTLTDRQADTLERIYAERTS